MSNRLTFSSTISQSEPGLNALKQSTIKPSSKPLKFMQIWNFYQPALDSLYSHIPNLAQRNFHEQIQELVLDGFGALHMLAPYMDDLGYQTTLIIANNAPSQTAWLNENQINYCFQADWVRDIARIQINTLKPDVLFISPIFYDSNFIRSLSWKPALVTGWCASDIPEKTDWREFDIIFSILSGIHEQAIKQGARASEPFMSGFPGGISKKVAHIQPKYDVVFCGQWTENQHSKRNAYIEAIARSASQGLFTCGFYLSGELDKLTPEVAKYQIGPRFGLGMYEALRSGRIVFDAKGAIRLLSTKTGKDLSSNETANMRILETTGVDRFLLTEYFSNLSQIFEPGVEIETFRNETELIEKICYYIDHPDEREAIARRGHERARHEHAMEKKVRDFDRILLKHLAVKIPSPPTIASAPVTESDSHLLTTTRSMLQAGNDEMVLAMLTNLKTRGRKFEGMEMLGAMCLSELGKIDEARQAFQTEIQNYPNNRENQQLFNQFESDRTAKNKKGNLYTGVSTGTQNNHIIYKDIEEKITNKKYQEALDLIAQEQVSDPANPVIITLKGNIFLQSGDIERARLEFVKSTILNPGYAPAFSLLGLILVFQEHYHEAQKVLNKAVFLNPDDKNARLLLAEVEKKLEPDRRNESAELTNRTGTPNIYKTDPISLPYSPLTGSKNIRLIREIAVEPAIQKFSNFQVSAEKYFHGFTSFQLYECLDSGYQFYYPFSLEGPADLYEQLEKISWYYMENKWEHQITNSIIQPGEVLLEVGSGRGAFIEMQTKRGIHATGLEINPRGISQAQAKGLHVLNQSVQVHAKLFPEKYDVVCMFQVLEHIADIREFLTASIQLVKPNGKLVISVPNNDAYILKHSSDSIFNQPPHHMGLWNTQSLIALTRFYNLQLVGLQYEPLQDYHKEWGKTIVKNQVLQQFPEDGKTWVALNSPLIESLAMMILKDIPGHSVLAQYTKK